MSLNDPFFDAWVRDKLLHTEARTPEHLWDKIRKRSRGYVVMERNKYLLILLLLLGVTTGTGYWAFHSRMEKADGVLAKRQSTTGHDGQSTLGHDGQSAPAANPSAEAPADAPSVAGVPASTDISTPADIPTSTHAPASTHVPIPADALAVAAPPLIPGGTLSGKTIAATAPDAGTAGTIADAETSSGSAAPFSVATPGITLNKAAMNDNLDEKNDLQGLSPFALALPSRPDAGVPVASPVNTNTLIHINTPRHTYLEIYAGPDHVKHYITTSNKAYDGYIAQVRTVENSYPSFSMGLRLDMPVVNNDWRVQLGLHYAQINEKMIYSNFDAVKTLTEISQHSVIQPNGTSVLVRDTSTVSVKGQFLKQSLNAYRMIDIPVLVSHTLFKTGQVQVNGSAGALFNVTSWYNGDVLDTTDVPTSIQTKTTQGASAWKKHIGTSLYGSLSLYDQVFKRVQATFEPYLRYDLSPVNKDLSIYKERFVTTGLMVGIRYQLGK